MGVNNYYAAVDKDGTKHLFYGLPKRNGDAWDDFWREYFESHMEGFPNITWDDEPVPVKLTIEVEG